MDLFLLKKIIGLAIMPMSIIVWLLIISLVFFTRKPKWSFISLFTATVTLVVSSIPWVGDRIMQPIEDSYPALLELKQPVDYIVILGCGHTTDNKIPATSQLKPCSLQRMVEGLRLYRQQPNAQIITSGGALGDPTANAVMVKNALVSLGVPEQKILVESYPSDTEEEAELIAPRVINKRVVLVTNADHMPRSVGYFAQHGVNVIPAPASPWVKGINEKKSWGYYAPNVKVLAQTTNAWYESLGRIVQWIKQV